MIVTAAQMRRIEENLLAGGRSNDSLMEEAGRGIADAVRQFAPRPGTCVAYVGKGHNGGDGCVAARHLAADGWQVKLRLSHPRDKLSPLTLAKLIQLGNLTEIADAPPDAGPGALVVLDALLGTGARPGLADPYLALCREINQLREHGHARVFALDLPSGLDSDSGQCDPDAVVADFTLTIGLPKSGLFGDDATAVVGRIALAPLAGAVAGHEQTFGVENTSFFMATSEVLRSLLPGRSSDSHKGEFGRLGIVAGAPGMTGAAALAATAAVRSGAGLVELLASRESHATLASLCPPEVMVRQVDDPAAAALDARFDALAIGPGLGRRHDHCVRTIVRDSPAPCVIDADALNALAEDTAILHDCRGPRLLTPHPGEMRRLADCADKVRWQIVGDFVREFPVTLLLKGARTLVGQHDLPTCANPSGSPALATGGSGDCLTGICGGLLAQRLQPYPAACLAAWLHGRAAEIALAADGQSPESFAASDIPRALGRAFHGLKQLDF